MDFQLKHDLHLHTKLSLCSRDPEQTVENIVAFAEKQGYTELCITDHFWDEAIPGPSSFYAPQNYAHITESLPLPKPKSSLRLMFGCETEFCGGKRLGITEETAEKLDFIIIPPNHFHMEGFTRDASVREPGEVAELFGRRLVELTKLSFPWEKTGIAHMTCRLTYKAGDYYDVFRRVDRGCLREAFAFFAEKGTGIELNNDCFRRPESLLPENLELYVLAKEAGCKFYFGSDAHHPDQLTVGENVPAAISLLGLTDSDRYTVPRRK